MHGDNRYPRRDGFGVTIDLRYRDGSRHPLKGFPLARHALAVIVIAQLLGTSLWFTVNGVGLSLQQATGIDAAGLGRLTIAVQAGFICGTLSIALSGLADRFRASRLFAAAAVAGALCNAAFILLPGAAWPGLAARFLTGLCLAGVYPLGMKLVVSWTPRHAGAALGWLVGMLTLGTALPHLLRGATAQLPWQLPLLIASGLALLAAALVFALGDGPHLPAPVKVRALASLGGFKLRNFRAAAFGYFGHCWELYALWTLVPFLAARELQRLDIDAAWLPWVAFAIIALGLPGCVIGGRLGRRVGSAVVARAALAVSGALCLLYPLLGNASPWLLLALLGLWGLSVIADSPQFSALASATAPHGSLGGTLAIMNAIGFSLTLPAIAVTTALWPQFGLDVLWLLLPGPVLGLLAMQRMPRFNGKPERQSGTKIGSPDG